MPLNHDDLLPDAPPDGATLVVGASGGVDSQSLVHWLARAPQGWRLVLAHLHHGLRGADADADAALVEETARGLGAAFECRKVGVTALARVRGLGIEEAGRHARREFFGSLANAHGATAIVTAHHADDQAETVWMNLQRGAGLRGLAGMRRWSGSHWRPWLDARREAILEYARANAIAFRDDASNSDLRFVRNRARAWLISEAQAGRDPVPHLLDMAASASALDEGLESWLDSVWDDWSERDGDSMALEQGRLLALDGHQRARMFQRAFSSVTGEAGGLYRVHLEALQRLLNSPRPNASLDLPYGMAARLEGGLLVVGPKPSPVAPWSLEITGEGSAATPAGVYRWRRAGPTIIPGCLCVDSRRADGPIRLRSIRPGDRFQPLGMPGGKKVARYLMDAKLPLGHRHRAAVLESQCQVLGVLAPGLLPRPDAGCAIGESTREMVVVEAVQT